MNCKDALAKRDYLRKHGECSKVDYGIRSLVSTLKRHGYETLYSCAGHKDVINRKGKVVPDKLGYVAIRGGAHDPYTLKTIASKYVSGVKIKKGRLKRDDGSSYAVTDIAFKAKNLGKWQGG